MSDQAFLLEKTWENIQKKTFTGFINSHLRKRNLVVTDIEKELCDGLKLIAFLEIIADDTFGYKYVKQPKLRIQSISNVGYCLQFIKSKGVNLVGIAPEEIVDGNLKMILGMIWTIILRFQIQEISLEELSAKEALLLWCQKKTEGYPGVNVKNFHTSFQDGLAFCALIHRHRPDLLNFDALDKNDKLGNLNLAFDVAEKHLDVPKLLDAHDILDLVKPDERSIITYVSLYYHVFASSQRAETAGRRVAKVIDFAEANDALKNDYNNRAGNLVDWIRQSLEQLNDRSFANTLDGIQNQISEFNHWKTSEKPHKTNEKTEIEALFSSLQTKLGLNGRPPFVPPSGLTPKDIDALWTTLQSAEAERAAALRAELRRIKKIEDLARRFNLLAGKLEAWASIKEGYLASTDYGDSISVVSAKLKNHDAYEAEYATQSTRVEQLRSLAAELEGAQYVHIDAIHNRLANLDQSWAGLNNSSVQRKQALLQHLEKLQQRENQLLDFAKRGLALKLYLEAADEILTDPIAVDTVDAIDELQASFDAFLVDFSSKEQEYRDLGDLAAELNNQGVAEDTFSDVSWQYLSTEWSKAQGNIETRREQLANETNRQTHHDQLRKQFAHEASNFLAWIGSQNAAIDQLHGDAEGQLQALQAINTDISSNHHQWQQLVATTATLDQEGITDNQYTTTTIESLKAAYEALPVISKKKEQLLLGQIAQSKHSALSAEQLQEFKECFKHFDKDEDHHLSRLELGALLKSLGEDLTFEEGGKLDAILTAIDEDGDGKVTYEEFVGYMEKISTDKDTPESIKAAFKVIAGDKEYVTEANLAAVLPPAKVAYLLKHMTPYPGVEGAYDYSSFTDHLYSM